MAEGRSTASKRGRSNSKRGRGKPSLEEGPSKIVDGTKDNASRESADDGRKRKVHRLRFLKQSIHPVRCLQWEPKSRRLAVSRSEGEARE